MKNKNILMIIVLCICVLMLYNVNSLDNLTWGLTHYYSMDSSDGSDNITRINTTIPNVTMSVVNGRFLDGSPCGNKYFNTSITGYLKSDTTLITTNKNKTINFWIRRSTTSTEYKIIYDIGDTVGSNMAGIAMYLNANTIDAVIGNGGTANQYLDTGTCSLSDTNWHDVTVLQSDANLSIWLDGSFCIASTVVSGSEYPSINLKSYILNDVGGGQIIQADLDEFATWNRTLTNTEIQSLYNSSHCNNFMKPQSVSALPATPLNISVVGIGDSIILGTLLNYNDNFMYKLNMSTNSGTNFSTINHGVGGYATSDIITHITDHTGKGYNYSVLMIGTNDMAKPTGVYTTLPQYYDNLINITKTLKADNQKIIITSLPPCAYVPYQECGTQTNQSYVIDRNRVIKRVSYQLNITFADIFHYDFKDTYNNSQFLDTIHPNESMHTLMNSTIWNTYLNQTVYNCNANPTECYNNSEFLGVPKFNININYSNNAVLNKTNNTQCIMFYNISGLETNVTDNIFNLYLYKDNILNESIVNINFTGLTYLGNFSYYTMTETSLLNLTLYNSNVYNSTILNVTFNCPPIIPPNPFTNATLINVTGIYINLSGIEQGMTNFNDSFKTFGILFLIAIMLVIIIVSLPLTKLMYIMFIIPSVIIFYYINDYDNLLLFRNHILMSIIAFVIIYFLILALYGIMLKQQESKNNKRKKEENGFYARNDIYGKY